MVTVLITSFLLIAAISYAFYCRQRASSEGDAEHRRFPPREGYLFGADTLEAPQTSRAPAIKSSITQAERAALQERAACGDRTALAKAAASGDAAFYDEVLNALVEHVGSDKKLLALVSHITRHEELRVNGRLAEAYIESWKASPDRSATAKMLHIAALADDAALYERAVETALQFWREGRIAGITASELRMLAESEYWLLSAGVRNSGAGFRLKRKLAGLRRELAAAKESIG
jgi:hypothetical protein